MDISNRTLGLLLVAAIVVSIGGTFISLNSLNNMSGGGLPTGFAITDTGNVTLNVADTVNILVNDSIINFGTCTMVLNASKTTSSYDSSGSPTDSQNFECSDTGGGIFPDNISVQNIGNVVAYVDAKIRTQDLPTTLFSDSAATFEFKGLTDAIYDGCGTPTSAWAALTDASDLQACGNLNFTDGNDQFLFFVRANLTQNSVTGGTAVVTFTAAAS